MLTNILQKTRAKQYRSFDYNTPYAMIPCYQDKATGRWYYGIGKNMRRDTEYVTHKVKISDTLDYLALKYYGNPTLWWAIAYFNNIQDPFIKLSKTFETIKIPNIASIYFK